MPRSSRDHLAAGDDGDVFQHRLAAVAEARRLHRRHLQAAAQLVDDEGGQRFAFDFLGDDEQRTSGLHHGFEDRQHGLQAGQLLLVDQDVGLFQLAHHLVGVGDEVGRDVAAVELHAFDDFELGVEALGLFDRDDAFIADFRHGFGDHLADGGVAIGGNRADLADFLVRLHLLGALLEVGDDGFHRLLDAALQIHRVHAGGNRFGALAHDRLGQNRRRGGAVAGRVVGLRRHLAHHLRAHVLELVGELDFLGDSHAVLGRARCAEALFDHDVAALGTQASPSRRRRECRRRGASAHARRRRILRLSLPFFVS